MAIRYVAVPIDNYVEIRRLSGKLMVIKSKILDKRKGKVLATQVFYKGGIGVAILRLSSFVMAVGDFCYKGDKPKFISEQQLRRCLDRKGTIKLS